MGWEGHNPNATFPCVAYTLRPISDEISHFSRQTAMPLTGRSLYYRADLHHALPFSGTYTLYATRQTFIATNRQIVRTPNLNVASFGRPFLWEVVDCHFTLPFVPVEWASPRQLLFSAGAGVPLHTQEWQFPIVLQGGVLETHHDEHPM